MERIKFKQLVESLGKFKVIKNGYHSEDYQETKFISNLGQSLCPVCNQGHELHIEKKWGYKDVPYWRWKCVSCKSTWQK
jgi:transposase-like protein